MAVTSSSGGGWSERPRGQTIAVHPIARMILQRLALGLVTLWAVTVIIFTSVQLLPGDLAQQTLGQAATPETVAVLRHQLGLDRPAATRYAEWLGHVVTGDFGRSLSNRRDISELIAGRLGNTLFLAGLAALIAVPASLTLGVLTALYRNSAFDRVANIGTLVSISLPEFFISYVLILLLSVFAGLFPPISNFEAGASLLHRIHQTVLPALALTLVVTAHMMRMTRAAIINILASPYIDMAHLKGLSRLRVVVHHALPNALAPIINVVALNVAYLVVGVVVVEVVFAYPGLGQLLVDSVSKRDVPVVQAACLIFGATFIVLNLVADVLSIVSNPRLLHAR